MRWVWRFWRKWSVPSPEAQAAYAQAVESSRRATRDLDRASAQRCEADEVAEIMASHNATNRYDEWYASRVVTRPATGR